LDYSLVSPDPLVSARAYFFDPLASFPATTPATTINKQQTTKSTNQQSKSKCPTAAVTTKTNIARDEPEVTMRMMSRNS
jgi:hypothetical protein